MGHVPSEFPSYLASVENLVSLYEVPSQLQSKLLIALLDERSKSLLAKLPKERLDQYTEVRDYLLREFNPPIPKLFRPPPPIVAFFLETLWHLIYHLMKITSCIEYLMRGIFNDTKNRNGRGLSWS